MQFVPDSPEAVRVFHEAEDIAAQSSQPLSSAHLVLAMFTFPNRAQTLLVDRGIDEDRLLREIRVLEEEPKRTVHKLRDRARELAKSSGSDEVDCLHVLIAISRLRDAFAYRLLERTGTSLMALRNVAVSYVTGNMPRRFKNIERPRSQPPVLFSRPKAQTSSRSLEAPATVLEREPDRDDVETPFDEFDPIGPAIDEARRTQTAAKPELKAAPKAAPTPAPSNKATPLAPAQPSRTNPVPRPSTSASPAQRKNARPRLEELAPTLAACGLDLTDRARKGLLDLAVGRERELEALIDTLGKRRANNPVLVGPPGVGKTAIVEGLAVKIARGDEDVAHFADRFVVALNTGDLVAGTSLRGAFSERLGAIKDEVARADRRIIVFIDELHTLIGAGASGESAQDAANELKAALARGEFPCIGATTHDEFKKHVEKDPALERRFTPITVEEPSVDEAVLILEGSIAPYAEHHQVDYALDAVHAAVTLSHRFIPDRQLPDKAFAVIDLAGSRAHRRGATAVERIDIARVIHEWSGVPIERLAEADADRFNRAEAILGEQLVGHDHVLSAVATAIRRGFAGFNSKRPIASMLFLGPTGVGKTELVKVLAEFLFGRREAVVRFDMSEMSEQHSVARLIGAQPGYVGYDEGGQLTEALRKRPFQIVLFDEIEKAHKDVLNLLLQILDEGHLTDSKGRRVSFANTVVVLTSNLGADAMQGGGRSIGFGAASAGGADDGAAHAVLEAARGQMAPELWGRLDERLVFHPLSRKQVSVIAALQLSETARGLFAEREIGLTWEDDVTEHLLDHGGYSPETGARGMRQTIQRLVQGPLAERILAGELVATDTAHLAVRDDSLVIHAQKSQAAAG